MNWDFDAYLNWYDDSFGWMFNHRQSKKVYDQGKRQYDKLPAYLDDPEKYSELYDDLIAGTIGKPLLEWYKDKKIREDAKRMDDDEKKNSGLTWENSLYKWWSYFNQSRSGRFAGSGSPAELFEASSSVVNSLTNYRKLLKW